jgi:hypothetical protein
VGKLPHSTVSRRSNGWNTPVIFICMSVFCPSATNNKPHERPFTAVLGVCFCWAMTALLGSSHDYFLNGIRVALLLSVAKPKFFQITSSNPAPLVKPLLTRGFLIG